MMNMPNVTIRSLIHDEILADKGDLTEEEFLSLMTKLPSWAENFPLDADGYLSSRYRK